VPQPCACLVGASFAVSDKWAPLTNAHSIAEIENVAYSGSSRIQIMRSLTNPTEARLLVDRLRHVTPQSVRRWGRM